MYNIYRYGCLLDPNEYTIDMERKIVRSEQNDLTFDFEGCDGWNLTGGHDCIFRTGQHCIFWSGDGCVFKTNSYCKFHAGEFGTFNTGGNCKFKIGGYATISSGSNCQFKVGNSSSIHTYDNCAFDTGHSCIIRLFDIKNHKFKLYPDTNDSSIILDYKDNNRYLLNDELVTMLKLIR